jgi:hypothetical protein
MGGFSSDILKKEGLECITHDRSLFLPTFEPVTDKGTNDEDDDKDDYPDENTDASCQSDPKAKEPGSKQKRDDAKDNPKDDTNDCPGLEEPPEIFLPFPEVPECDTNNENQQFKPHVNTPDNQQYRASLLKNVPEKRLNKAAEIAVPVPDNNLQLPPPG